MGHEILEEVNRLRNSPGKYVSMVISEYKANQDNYSFQEFQIIINQLELQDPVAKLRWEDGLYALGQQTLLDSVPGQEPPSWLNVRDFELKTVPNHVISMLLNGHLKKLLSPEMKLGAVAVKDQPSRTVLLKLADAYGQAQEKLQLETLPKDASFL